ncbi:hypothetical protein N9R79_06620 [Vibrio sp.]|nr:hypothetical protein [Vibrio sp.]
MSSFQATISSTGLASALAAVSISVFNVEAANINTPQCVTQAVSSYVSAQPDRDMIIMVDQTMVDSISATVAADMYRQLEAKMKAGVRIQLISFSSFSKGNYAKHLFTAQWDKPIPSRYMSDIGSTDKRRYAQCLKKQNYIAKRGFGQALATAFIPPKSSDNTEIMSAFQQVSQQVLPVSMATDKTIILISDMLEHSATTSFYSRNRMKKIQVDKELSKVKQANGMSHLRGAKVYVMGAGLSSSKNGYVSQQAMTNLERFWQGYIKASQGELMGFGTPILLNGIAD